MDNICANPFVVYNKYSLLDYFKILLMSVPAMIRLFFFALFMISSGVTAHIMFYIRVLHQPKDYVKWKRYYTFLPTFCIRCAIFCLGFFKINVIDKVASGASSVSHVMPLPIQLMAPHSSMYDFFAVTVLGLPVFVTRQEILNVWIVSKLVALGNPITVNRGEVYSRKEAMELIKRRSLREQVLLFPEGTNTNREMLIRFRVGAFNPGLPVQPVVLQYPRHNIDSYSWAWEGPSAKMGFFLTSCKLSSSMTLVKLPPYVPNVAEKEDPVLFATNVQEYIARETKIRISMYSYDDTPFLQLAAQANIPRSPLGLKLLKLCRKMMKLGQTRNQDLGIWINEDSTRQVLKETKYRQQGICTDTTESDDDSTLLHILLKFCSCKVDNFEYDDSVCVSTTIELIRVLGLEAAFPELANCVVTQELLAVLKGSRQFVTRYDILMAFTLCNNRKWSLWDRIKDVFMLQRSKGVVLDHIVLTEQEFKRLVWYLLGLEESLIDMDILGKNKLDFDYLRQNLVRLFERAVQENAKGLLLD